MRLQNQNIFILSLAKYDDEIESTMFTMARQLAKKNNVFYIENPYTWKDAILRRRRKDFVKKKRHFSFGCDDVIETDTPSLKVVISPLLMSVNWLPQGLLYRSMQHINERMILHRIRQIVRKFGIEDYIFINAFNFYYPGVGKLLAPSLNVYHCVDPIVFGVDRKHGLSSEKRAVAQSDLVICTSKRLFNEKAGMNSNTFFIPNAADIQHSNKALEPGLPVHPSLADIKGPVVGYFGTIERRMNYDLLDYVTYLNSDISFVFAGPASSEFIPSWFYERPNVHLTGSVPYPQMPQVLKGFDVAIIPFKKDSFSTTIFPLKLFEYLGSGKPVVSTDFNPDLDDFTHGTVPFCKTARSFSLELRKALTEDTEQQRAARLAIAAQNTWERRADEFADKINSYLIKNKREASEEMYTIRNEAII